MTAAPARPAIVDRLAVLDQLLKHAVERARATFDAGAQEDPFRGTYISDVEAEKLAAGPDSRAPLTAGDEIAAALEALDEWPELDALAAEQPLTPFDRAVVLFALAPELELRYERLYAYLQDDVTKRRPTVDLALSLLSAGVADRLAHYDRFEPGAPLAAQGLLRLVADPAQVEPPLIAHFLKLDQTAIDLLARGGAADPRLASIVERLTPQDDAALAGDATARRLAALVLATRIDKRGLAVLLNGPAAAPKRDVAAAVARLTGTTFLVVNLTADARWRANPADAVVRTGREAALASAALYVDGLDEIAADNAAGAQAAAAALRRFRGVQFIATTRAWPAATWPDDAVAVPLAPIDYTARRALWGTHTAAAGFALDNDALRRLASFELTPQEIAAAVAATKQRLKWRLDLAAPDRAAAETAAELSRAVRAQSSAELAELTRRVDQVYTWADLVVPADVAEQLDEICARVNWRYEVLDGGGFGAKLSAGKGIATLFSGPPGTGKSMAAEVLANRLGLDLFRVDLSTVVSKYIGETEKNLERIFRAAERSNSVLLFDEGEALCGKRSEVRDAHDRYANIEISYLLQRMELYEGLTILTTNLRGNIDEAFLRRLAFSVHFPFPTAAERARIWRQIWPSATTVDPAVDFDALARLHLSGGNIKNIALAAAFLAAADSQPVQLRHIVTATRREYEKAGKAYTNAEVARLLRTEAVA